MKNIIITFCISITLIADVFAQYGSEGTADARSMGLGKTANAISGGVFSIGINPANLFNTKSSVDFSTVLPLPNVSASAGTNFISLNNINYYSGRNMTDADKQNLSSIFQNGGLISGNVSFTLFSFALRLDPSIGAFGISVNDFVSGDFTVPQSFSGLILYGNPQNSIYNFDDAKFNSWWLRNYSFSYAREIEGLNINHIEKIFAGFTVKYYQGFSYAQSVQANNNSIKTGANNQITLNSNYVIQSAFSDNFNVKYSFDSASAKGNSNVNPFPSPAGTGIGFDIGLSGTIYDDLTVSLAVTDIGSISWTKNTAITTAGGKITISDIFDKSLSDSLKSRFKGTSVPAGSFTTELPTTLRIGAAHLFNFNKGSFPGTLLVAADINRGFNDEPGNSTKTRFSICGEYQLAHGVPYIRTGFSFGGLLGFRWGAGLGIDAGPLEFNFSTLDFESLVAPSSAKLLSFAFDSRWKF